MEVSQNGTVKIIAALLVVAATLQPIYTALYLFLPAADRLILWSVEALLFVLLAAFAGSALAMAKHYTLGFSAIAFSAVFNVIQVGVGLTQFGPIRTAAEMNSDFGNVEASILAFSFFGYNAAKTLLGLATVVFGMAVIAESSNQSKRLLGSVAVLVGVVALGTNAYVMMFGLQAFIPPPVAGGAGVMATLLLALCLVSVSVSKIVDRKS